MDSTWLNPKVEQSLRIVRYRVEELVHVCAVYLGIAVIVTVAAGLVVPAMREQAKQLYTVAVEALRPEALRNDSSSQFSWLMQPAAEGGRSQQELVFEEVASSSAYTRFAQVLERSVKDPTISGVSRAQYQALRSYIARKYKIAHSVAGSLIHTAFVVGREKNIDPQLILAVIAIESSYNPFAESHAGAQGLMQVMTRVHTDKLEAYEEGVFAVFSPEANIRAGTQILYDCKKRRGSIAGALRCYVGATGPSDGGYGNRVLAERRRIALASGIPVRD